MYLAETKEKIHSLLTPIAERYNAFVVDLVIRNERGARLVQVFLDTDQGIKIEDCAAISRELGKALEEEGIFQTSYHLEVSSPGIDRPLKLLRLYQKNIGRRFKVQYRLEQGSATFVGVLKSVEDDQLTFVPDNGEPKTLPFSQIIESKEELPW